MTIHTTKSRKSNTTIAATFNIMLNDDESVQFNPTKTFAHVDIEQVLKIITKGKVEACEVNKKGYINYQVSDSNKTLGFINFYANGLDEDSDIEDIDASVDNLIADLSLVKVENISMPMTSGEADDLIAGL